MHNDTQTTKKLQHEVHDLTKDGIDEEVKAYLKLGPDFSETPRALPYEKIIIETESITQPEQSHILERERERQKLRESKTENIKTNLTSVEEKGRKKGVRRQREGFPTSRQR